MEQEHGEETYSRRRRVPANLSGVLARRRVQIRHQLVQIQHQLVQILAPGILAVILSWNLAWTRVPDDELQRRDRSRLGRRRHHGARKGGNGVFDVVAGADELNRVAKYARR